MFAEIPDRLRRVKPRGGGVWFGAGKIRGGGWGVAQSSSRGVKRCKHLGDIEPSAQSDSLLRNLMRKIH